MAAFNTLSICILCILIGFEFVLIEMKWSKPDIVSYMFTVFFQTIGLSSFQLNYTQN